MSRLSGRVAIATVCRPLARSSLHQKVQFLTPVRAFQFFQVMRFGAFFLTGVLFAKLGLGAYGIGIYESLLFLGSLLSFFWLSGLSQSLLANCRSQERFTEFFNAFLVLAACSALVFVLFRLLITPFSFLANNPEVLWHYASFSWYLLFIGPSYLAEYVLLLRERSRSLVFYGVFAFGGQLLLVALPVYLGYGLDGAIAGLVVSAGLRLLVTVGLLWRFAEWRVDREFLTRFISTATPLMLATLLSGSAEYLDGLIVSRYFDEGTFAAFRYGAKEFPLVLLLANAFSNGMVPAIGRDLKDGLQQLTAGSARMMHAFFPLSIVLMLISPWAYPMMFSAEFAASAQVFNVYLLLVVSRVVFPQTVLIGLRRSRAIMTVAMIELLMNVGLSLLFVQWFGLVGIAYATVIAYSFEKILLMMRLWKDEGISPTSYWPWRLHLVYTAVLVGVHFILV
jgi:O-antigen/teichoic acid export membrane protein